MGHHLGFGAEALTPLIPRPVVGPGDQDRADRLTHAITEDGEELSRFRGLLAIRGRVGRRSPLLSMTGTGGSSASIVMNELMRLGFRAFMRVGTTGSLDERIIIVENSTSAPRGSAKAAYRVASLP